MVHRSTAFKNTCKSVSFYTPTRRQHNLQLHGGVEMDVCTQWNIKRDKSSMMFHPKSQHQLIYHIQTKPLIIQTQKQTSTENRHGYHPHFQSIILGCIMTLCTQLLICSIFSKVNCNKHHLSMTILTIDVKQDLD